MDDSTGTINEAIQLVEDRLASRVSIVFSRDFLEEFPSSAQTYFNEGRVRNSIYLEIGWRVLLEANLEEQMDEDESEDESSSSVSSVSAEPRTRNDQRQHRCIKQMGKLTKVECADFLALNNIRSIKILRPYLESSMDVEILEKFIAIIDENRPILSRF